MNARTLFDSLIDNCGSNFVGFSELLESRERFEVLNAIPSIVTYLESQQFYPTGFVLQQEQGGTQKEASNITQYALLTKRLERIADDVLNGDTLFELHVEFFKKIAQKNAYQHMLLVYKDNTSLEPENMTQDCTAFLHLDALGMVLKPDSSLAREK
ncbi:hypothetical protein COT72_04650 [archaeon CG10_big_fil_rev_8_21_14_0_10_43_11]|nr:MAG: hypothetical protein COT72_04650 [archaeon CG10_big_fil_rev_8_21_14_0_10_43_11]